MKGREVIAALKKKFRVTTDRDLAEVLGITVTAIQFWKNGPSVTTRQCVGLVHSASRRGAQKLGESALRPLVEFFPIDASESRHGASWELFAAKDDDGVEHPFRHGLKSELAEKHGVYLFFDSRGQAIYAGKARKQSLWKEMNLAFNRSRGGLQKIKRVNHPTRRQAYKTSEERARQIVDIAVPLHDVARYFSAYEVTPSLIDDVEALLVRSFANDLLNKRMEKFGNGKR